MKKKTPKPSLHNADKWFSILVRVNAADQAGDVTCCSCGRRFQWRDVDAGHFIPRQHRAVRFDTRNVHPQCRKCNRFDNGNPVGYSRFLIRTYGVRVLEELQEKSHHSTRWSKLDIQQMADDFRERATELANIKGLKL